VAIVEGVQEGETEEMVEELDEEPEGLLPPQAESVTRSNDTPRTCGKGPFARWRPELPIWTLLPWRPKIYQMLNVIER
jgi:hypothetical protein